MKYSHWPGGDYPIFINPDDAELVEAGELLDKWDTLRICVDDDNIGIGSGMGNTHDSVTKAMIAKHCSRGLPETFILFRQGDNFYFNLEDVTGERAASFRRAVRENFSKRHEEILTTLVQIRSTL